jgi:hypothetical protein
MDAKKKKQWALFAPIAMTLAALIYFINGLMYGFDVVRTLVTVLFSISAVLYWYRFKTTQFEDD